MARPPLPLLTATLTRCTAQRNRNHPVRGEGNGQLYAKHKAASFRLNAGLTSLGFTNPGSWRLGPQRQSFRTLQRGDTYVVGSGRGDSQKLWRCRADSGAVSGAERGHALLRAAGLFRPERATGDAPNRIAGQVGSDCVNAIHTQSGFAHSNRAVGAADEVRAAIDLSGRPERWYDQREGEKRDHAINRPHICPPPGRRAPGDQNTVRDLHIL